MQTKYTGKNSHMTDKEVKFLTIKMLLRICKEKLNIQGEKEQMASTDNSAKQDERPMREKSVQPH